MIFLLFEVFLYRILFEIVLIWVGNAVVERREIIDILLKNDSQFSM